MDLKQKRLRFSEDDNLTLLRQVAGLTPFQDPSHWKTIQENMFSISGKDFLIRTLRDHMELLLKMWLEKEKINKAKSGIEEIYTEKDVLLQEIFSNMQEFKRKPKILKKTTVEKIGKENREKWTKILAEDNMSSLDQSDVTFDHNYSGNIMVENIIEVPSAGILAEEGKEESFNVSQYVESNIPQEGSSLINQPTPMKSLLLPRETRQTPRKTLVPTRARQRRTGIQQRGLNYLEDYDKKQFELKKKDQELEERRVVLAERQLNLEERKFALSEFEKKKHFEILEKKVELEIEERRRCNKVIDQQEKMINILLGKFQTSS